MAKCSNYTKCVAKTKSPTAILNASSQICIRFCSHFSFVPRHLVNNLSAHKPNFMLENMLCNKYMKTHTHIHNSLKHVVLVFGYLSFFFEDSRKTINSPVHNDYTYTHITTKNNRFSMVDHRIDGKP